MAAEINKHRLIPQHTKLNETDKSKVLEHYHITISSLPKITKDDPAITKLSAKPGDVIKVIRESKTAGRTEYYRAVIEG